MSTLVALPIPNVFGTVPLLEDAAEEFERKEALKQLQNLGAIFVRHGVYADYGLTMLHRHFEILEQEILVESIRNDNELSLFVPWSINSEKKVSPTDNELWSSYGMADSEKNYVIPQHWSFSDVGQLQPLEFLATNNKELIKTPPQEFVFELFAALKDIGLHHVVGLRSREHFRNIATYETTPENIRGSVVARGKKPDDIQVENMLQVLWQFNEKGELTSGNSWCGVCVWCGECKNQNP